METAVNNSLIQVSDLKKYYNKGVIKALDDISVNIERGDVMVVIGPSGSGKSTFLRSLNMVGPYPFLHVYEQPVWASVLWFIAIPGGAYLIALLLRFGRRRCAKKLAGAK